MRLFSGRDCCRMILMVAGMSCHAAAPGSPVLDAARARVQDAETLRALSDEGKLLYARERVKLTGYQYCGQAVALAERGELRLSIQDSPGQKTIVQREMADKTTRAASVMRRW